MAQTAMLYKRYTAEFKGITTWIKKKKKLPNGILSFKKLLCKNQFLAALIQFKMLQNIRTLIKTRSGVYNLQRCRAWGKGGTCHSLGCQSTEHISSLAQSVPAPWTPSCPVSSFSATHAATTHSGLNLPSPARNYTSDKKSIACRGSIIVGEVSSLEAHFMPMK